MNEKEYLTTNDVAKIVGLSTQTIRRKIKTIQTSKTMIYKDHNGQIKIHHLLLSHFGRATPKPKMFAFSLDFNHYQNNKEINQALEFGLKQLNSGVIMEYVVEQKKKNNMLHIHASVEGVSKDKFIKMLKVLFGQSWKVKQLFDLEHWEYYMLKENKEITIIKNN